MIRFFKKTQRLILSKQESLLSSTLIISGMIAFSRILGFIRYRVFSYYFTKEETDIFYAAFKVPDALFEILVLGTLSYTLIPLFLKYKKRSKNFSETLSATINLFVLFLLVLTALVGIFTPQIIQKITPGFSPETQQTIAFYTRIILFSQVPFLTFGNILIAIGQSEKRFFLTSLAPLLYNLSIIFSTLALANTYGISAIILGVILGSFLFFLSQIPVLKSTNFKYKLTLRFNKSFKEFLNLSVIRVLMTIFKQIEGFVELALSTLLGPGAYTAFFLAQRLQLLPIALIGQSISQASYPFISSLAEQGKKKELSELLRSSLLLILYLTVPMSFFFIFARTPLIRIFFGGPKFDWEATVSTAYTFSFFAFSIPFHSSFYLINKSFFSLFKAKIPLIINSLATLLTILLSFLFIKYLNQPVWYLALAFSISITLNTLILAFILHKELQIFNSQSIWEIVKIYSISGISAFISYQFMRLLDGLFIETVTFATLILLMIATSIMFLSLFLFQSWLVGIKQFGIIIKIWNKINRYGKGLIQYYNSVE